MPPRELARLFIESPRLLTEPTAPGPLPLGLKTLGRVWEKKLPTSSKNPIFYIKLRKNIDCLWSNHFSMIKINTAPPAYSRRFGLEARFPTPPRIPTPAPVAALVSLNAFPSTGIEDMMLFASAIPDKAESVLPMFILYLDLKSEESSIYKSLKPSTTSAFAFSLPNSMNI